jgi:hypothetical protein
MQRIDENTYIDDTLVTCAEYQLFIDEMREQGKYYQPDHWISYQFPGGQARGPILGVRFDDAKAFCEWRTEREGNIWIFRLPRSKEAKKYPLNSQVLFPLGYWIIGHKYWIIRHKYWTIERKDEQQFAWVGRAWLNPRKIYLEHVVDLAVARSDAFIHQFASDDVIAQDLIHNIERVGIRRIFQTTDLNFNHAIAHATALDLGVYLHRILGEGFDFAILLNHALSYSVQRDHDFASKLEDALDNALTQSISLSGSLFEARKIISLRNIARARAIAVDLYIDLFTLQERVAGRSPAFEGIRLVKERRL